MKRISIVIPACFLNCRCNSGRDNLRKYSKRESRKWIPAFAGMTLFMLCAGCQTAPPKDADATVIVGGSQVDLKKLAVQVQKDPQARSAVTAVNSAFNMRDTAVKYCPVDGKRFSSRLEYCPEHHVKLIPVE